MNKTIWVSAALLGATAVILGALGAHALQDRLTPDSLESFRTAVDYQMYHALFLLFLGSQSRLKPGDSAWVFRLILFGVVFFSGSIYLLSTRAITGVDFSPIAWITPLGGVLLISGWGWFFYRVLRFLD